MAISDATDKEIVEPERVNQRGREYCKESWALIMPKY